MSISNVAPPTAVRPVARAVAPLAGVKAVAPREAVVAQGKAAKPTKFADVSSYKAHVLGTEVVRLPAARQAAATADARLADAKRALAAKMQSLGHDGLQAALTQAEQALEQASWPMRGAAATKKAEAQAVASQIAGIAGDIARAQQQIGQAEASRAARNRDAWWGDHSKDTGWDVLADGLGALGDAGAISSGNRRVQDLVRRKVELEQKALALTMEATALEHTPGPANLVAAATEKRDHAKLGLDAAIQGESTERAAVAAAQNGANGANGEVARLEGLKQDLTNYGAHFGLFTRIKMKCSNWHWKRDLDNFFKSQGL